PPLREKTLCWGISPSVFFGRNHTLIPQRLTDLIQRLARCREQGERKATHAQSRKYSVAGRFFGAVHCCGPIRGHACLPFPIASDDAARCPVRIADRRI